MHIECSAAPMVHSGGFGGSHVPHTKSQLTWHPALKIETGLGVS